MIGIPKEGYQTNKEGSFRRDLFIFGRGELKADGILRLLTTRPGRALVSLSVGVHLMGEAHHRHFLFNLTTYLDIPPRTSKLHPGFPSSEKLQDHLAGSLITPPTPSSFGYYPPQGRVNLRVCCRPEVDGNYSLDIGHNVGLIPLFTIRIQFWRVCDNTYLSSSSLVTFKNG